MVKTVVWKRILMKVALEGLLITLLMKTCDATSKISRF
jgi:hypothetical protein